MKNYKLQHNYKIIVILTTIFVTLSCNSNRLIYVQNLRCEHLANPLGINSRQPRFSWINISDQQGSVQTSYQIIVASEKDILTEDKNDYWNSGKVNSSESHLITYKGKDLKSGQILYWKVRVWDQNDNVSEWSEP
jgi:alpha-L-rhamnosidase